MSTLISAPLALPLLILLPIAAAAAQSDEGGPLDLRSAYLTDAVAGAHRIQLQRGADGATRLVLDPNRCRLDAFGDADICTKMATRVMPVQLTAIERADPTGAGRALYALHGALPDGVTMTLVTGGKAPTDRLVVTTGDEAGRSTVVPLFAPPTAASSSPTEDLVAIQAGDLELKLPKTWQRETPRSSMRLLQMRVPAAEGVDDGTAELIVFRFAASDIDANIDRWIGQFEADGRTTATKTGECPHGTYTLVEISGTYRDSMGLPGHGTPTARPGTRVVHVIVQTEPQSMHFLKLVGPDATVAASAASLRAAFGGDAAREKKR